MIRYRAKKTIRHASWDDRANQPNYRVKTMKRTTIHNIRTIRSSVMLAGCIGMFLLIPSVVTAQNLFVSSGGGGILEYTQAGVQSTFASGLQPNGLAFNSAGDLFEADNHGNIYEFSPSGVRSTFFASSSSLIAAYGLAFNSAGDLFESDGRGNIYEFSPGGVRSTFASGLSFPSDLAFNGAGDLFVVDRNYGTIYEYAPNGVRTTFATGLYGPLALAFDGAGDLFTGDRSDHIYEYSPTGVRSIFASGFYTGVYPTGLAFNSAGDLFAADGSSHIYEYTPGGRLTFASPSTPYYLTFQPVPEPSVFWLLAVGVSALYVRRRFRYLGSDSSGLTA